MWGKIKVLMVKDEAITGAYIRKRLEDNGKIGVENAKNSHKAIKISKPEKPKIIIMEVNLKKESDGITKYKFIIIIWKNTF